MNRIGDKGITVPTQALLGNDSTRVAARKVVNARDGNMGRGVSRSEFGEAVAQLPQNKRGAAWGVYATLSALEAVGERRDQDYYIVGPSDKTAKIIAQIQTAIDNCETWEKSPPVLKRTEIDIDPEDEASADLGLFFDVHTQDEEKLAKLVDSFSQYNF